MFGSKAELVHVLFEFESEDAHGHRTRLVSISPVVDRTQAEARLAAYGLTSEVNAVRLSDTASSRVVAARRVHDARECAIKMIRKSRCRTARDAARIGREVAVLRRLRHPSIVPLLECWHSADHVCLVFPRHATDLFDFSTPHRDGMPVE